jgi:hypothetical protein
VEHVSTRLKEFNFENTDQDGFNYSHGQNSLHLEPTRELTKKMHHSVFRGISSNNNSTARGKQVWTDGTTYEGNYRDGMWNGKGRLISVDGDFFEGDFQNNSGKKKSHSPNKISFKLLAKGL